VVESHPPNPRSKTTVSAVTGGNIAGLLATEFVALFVGFSFESYSRMLWNRKIGYGGELWRGGEGRIRTPDSRPLIMICSRAQMCREAECAGTLKKQAIGRPC
jgi:hypothetical protein